MVAAVPPAAVARGFSGDGATPQSGGYLVTAPSFGPFGNAPQQDVPFSVTSIPQAIIQDQQARTTADVLRNDPSVYQSIPSNQSGYSNFSIRGFDASDAQSNRVDGLPFSTQGTELIYGYERVDIFKGTSGLLYGFANPGGVVNYVTKKPLSAPLTDLSFNYISPTWFGGTADISRRFGEMEQFGVRANFAAHEGDVGVNGQKNTDVFGALAFDWRFTPTSRAWVNMSYGKDRYDGIQPNFLLGNFGVPSTPSTSHFYGQPYSFHQGQNETITGGFEGDITPWLSGHATAGAAAVYRDVRYQGATLLDNFGDYQLRVNPHNMFHITDTSAEAVLTPHVEAGIFKNKLDIGATFNREDIISYNVQGLGQIGPQNFNNTFFAPDPVTAYNTGAAAFSSTRLNNYTARDTLDVTRYLTLMGGVAYSTVDQFVSSSAFGANQQKVTPSAAIILKPTDKLSFYGSYIQGLQAGAQAALNFAGFAVTNANQFLQPFLSTQYEAGIKYDVNDALQLNSAVFQVTNPNALYVANNAAGTSYTFTQNGIQRNQGIEFTAIGRLYEGLRIFSGATYIDPRILNSQGATLNGFDAIGVPRVRGNIFLEYDIAAVRGLTLMGGAFYTGRSFVNSLNTAAGTVPGYVTADLGAKYTTNIAGNLTTIRLYVKNFTGKNYWLAEGSSTLALGDPRTFRLDVSMKF